MKTLKRELPLHLMLLPAVVILLVYSYYPMMGIFMAFQRFVPSLGIFRSKWVGFDNFIYLFNDPSFIRALLNTFFIASMKIVTGLIVPVVFALLLNEIHKSIFKRSVQTLLYLPYFLSWVILGGITVDMLSPQSGIVNQAIKLFGGEPIFFLADNTWFPITLVITHLWKEFGWGTIIYLAALTGIDPSLYEAAHMDGANRWNQTLHITIPGIATTVVLLSTLSLGNVLNAGFEQVFNLYSPVVYRSGDIIDTLVYRMGLESAQFSPATAAGLFKSVVSFIMITLAYRIADKTVGYRVF